MKALLKMGAVLMVFGLVLSAVSTMVIRAHAVPDVVAKTTQGTESPVTTPAK